MSMTRQQRRAQERVEQVLARKIENFRRTNPMAEETYKAGYTEGWSAACNFAMKSCYAAATLALHDLEGYSTVRNARFLRAMDNYIVNSLSSEEIIDDALSKAGVAIDFREPFPEDRIQEAET
jgi:hypothetical protein